METRITQVSILRSYKLYKTEFGFELYLLQIKDFRLRKSLSKLRLSSHTLSIESGRHCKPKLVINERLCKFCSNCIETEEHFLLHCPFYNEERERLLTNIILCENRIVVTQNAHEVFVNLMSTKNCEVLFSLCKFIHKGFKKREPGLAGVFTL